MTALISNSRIKRCISLFLMILTVIMMLGVIQSVAADEAETRTFGHFEYIIESGEVCITKYTGDGGDVSIPDTIDGKTVVAIGDEAFWYRTDVTAVDLPTGLEYIGARAFQGCDKLTSVALPDTVYEIGDACFTDCTGLISINIPSELLYVGGFAFDNTPWLTKYSDNTSIIFGSRVFYKYLGDAEAVVIPEGVTGISSNAFEGNKTLKYVSIPESALFIGDLCFLNCDELKSIKFPDNIYFIGEYCFGYKTVAGKQEPELYDGVTVYSSADKPGASYALSSNIKLGDVSEAPTPDELPAAETCVAKPYVVKENSNSGLFTNQNSVEALVIIVVACVVIIGGITLVLTITEKKNKKIGKQIQSKEKKVHSKKKKK